MAQAISAGRNQASSLSRGNNTGSAPGMPTALMYHSVEHYRTTPTGSPSARTVRPQMGWLPGRGLRGVALAGTAARARGGRRDRLVGLTFDDGYADFPDPRCRCWPQYGFTATVFVVVGRLGGDNAWDRARPAEAADDRRPDLPAAGCGLEIGSHGLFHRLPECPGTLAEETGAAVRCCGSSSVSRSQGSATPTARSTRPRWPRSATVATTTAAPSGARAHQPACPARATSGMCGQRQPRLWA